MYNPIPPPPLKGEHHPKAHPMPLATKKKKNEFYWSGAASLWPRYGHTNEITIFIVFLLLVNESTFAWPNDTKINVFLHGMDNRVGIALASHWHRIGIPPVNYTLYLWFRCCYLSVVWRYSSVTLNLFSIGDSVANRSL